MVAKKVSLVEKGMEGWSKNKSYDQGRSCRQLLLLAKDGEM